MPETTKSITFPRDLFLDRRKGKYCFRKGPDVVRMAEAGKPIGREELKVLFHPYGPVTIQRFEDMFDEEVLPCLAGLGSRPPAAQATAAPIRSAPAPGSLARESLAWESAAIAASVRRTPPAAAPAAAPPAPAAASPPPPFATPPRAPAPPPAPAPSTAKAPGGGSAGPAAAKESTAAPPPPPPPPPPPSVKLASLRADLRAQVFQKIATSEGEAALLAGRMDGEIRGLVSEICKEVTPRQIIAAPPGGEAKTDTDFYMDHAMTSQAFGAQLALGQTDLFLVVKSAILQTLTEADRKNIQAIKQSLLSGKASPNFAKRLSQYYQEIVKYLKANKTDAAITDLIYRSKYVYFEETLDHLPPPSIALGVADAYVTLREAGRFTLEILGSLPARLKRLLPPDSGPTLASIENLLRESCYNEFRKALDARLSGGDHCDFFALSPSLYGILIFDVSGHEAQASALKEVLVRAIGKLNDRTDPARTLNALNRFVLQYPFPEECFVSMVYGLVDLREGRFIYANAGHHPPYLIRNRSLNRLDRAGGIALNMGDEEFRNGSSPLQPMDCLVLYTDGLTEAVSRKGAGGSKELFGHRRLENAIAQKSIGALKAKRAVESILAAVHDQGFQIEDDITIQVYRHV